MKKEKFLPLIKETYLAVIKNSIGSNTWRNFYAKIGPKKIDIMRNGDLSCAFFVSSILTLFGLVEKVHGTVGGTVFDLEKSGWQKLKKVPTQIKSGAVIVWETKIDSKGESHKHIGFYFGDNQAISNSSKSGKIVGHHLTFGGARAIEAIYTHKKLN